MNKKDDKDIKDFMRDMSETEIDVAALIYVNYRNPAFVQYFLNGDGEGRKEAYLDSIKKQAKKIVKVVRG